MLQEASTHLIIPEPSEDLIINEPWSIDIYAEGLMDELFADIDYILDGNGNLPSQTVRHGIPYQLGNFSVQVPPEYAPLHTVTVPQIVLPNTVNSPGKAVSQVRRNHLNTFVVGNASVNPVSKKRHQPRRIVGKLLILGTTLGLAIAGSIYLVKSGFLYLLDTQFTQQALQVPELPTKTDVEAELVDYMLEALAVIDKQEAKNNQKYTRLSFTSQTTSNQTGSTFTSQTGNLPPLLASNNTLPASNRSGNFVERIYIPVYRAPSPMRYALPAIPGSPTPLPAVVTPLKASQADAVRTALTTVRQAAKPIAVNMVAAAVRSELKPVSVRTAPITVRQVPNLMPALPVVPLRPTPTPAATPDSEPTITQEQVYAPTPISVASSNTLEGLLELGNKSAALFKIDGVTRRIDVGESIGSSGWTLVEVNNGEAIIRRNGEVRSIYAGQGL